MQNIASTNHSKTAILVVVLLYLLSGCKPDDISTEPLGAPTRPAHFPAAHYQPTNNSYSKEKFLLGRKLFFDPLLSEDNTISCASCHHQQFAFSDAPKRLSLGIQNLTGSRNSPPIFNMAWNKSFMWDGGVNHIEVLSLAPIANPVEMNQDLVTLLEKLKNDSTYPSLFQKTFAKDSIDSQQLLWALAHFMSNIVSADSKYDQYQKGEIALSKEEQEGLVLFRQHCENCHKEPLFTDYSFHNNGLDSSFADAGRYRITLNPLDLGKFKTPTLRNILLTPPYMHDGRFENIEDVLEHYSEHIKPSTTLAPFLQQNMQGGGIALSASEKEKLITFLQTLTDYELLTNPDYSE